ncbi:MAG: hypothetical protein ABI759_08670 [Candidatus Solibacter sp.]
MTARSPIRLAVIYVLALCLLGGWLGWVNGPAGELRNLAPQHSWRTHSSSGQALRTQQARAGHAQRALELVCHVPCSGTGTSLQVSGMDTVRETSVPICRPVIRRGARAPPQTA